MVSEISEGITWEICPRSGRRAAVGWSTMVDQAQKDRGATAPLRSTASSAASFPSRTWLRSSPPAGSVIYPLRRAPGWQRQTSSTAHTGTCLPFSRLHGS
jgi:hypothetical protein